MRGQPVGRVDFVDSPKVDGERIVFHIEVDREFGGRGLAGQLVREALADSICTDVAIVPVCPLFAGHLRRHGDELVAACRRGGPGAASTRTAEDDARSARDGSYGRHAPSDSHPRRRGPVSGCSSEPLWQSASSPE
ncbi:GNAT family N-acetyltransferase [Micromonospora profundi]|uniref:GNAT family N-acetyltransferase n=1 Tax=Micromonospora profundi TaxID=1420889 RepID=UPI003655E462